MRAARLATASVVAVLVLLVWATHIIPGERVEFRNADLFGYYYPAYAAAFAHLGTGALPLWNPYQLCGEPWLATLQAGVFYPPHLLFLVLPTGAAMAASAAAHLLLVGLGTALFARRVGLGGAAATMAALLLVCRGHLPILLYWPPSFEAAAWLPLGGVALVGIARGNGRRPLALLAVALAGSLLAGNAQITVYVVYAWAVLQAALLAAERAPAGRWLTAGLGFACALGIGALVASVQLLPTLELGAQGVRGARALTVTQMYPMGGAVRGNAAYGFLRTDALGRSPLGFGPIGLALLLPALGWGSPRALAWGALALGLGALGFALGPVTPAFGVLRHLPALSWFRLPHYALFVLDVAFALVAAIGLHTLATTERLLPGVVAAAGALVLATLATTGAITTNAPTWLTWIAAAVFCGISLSPGYWRRFGVAMLVGLAALDVALAPPAGLGFPYGTEIAGRVDAAAPLYQQIAAFVGPDRFWLFTTETPPLEIGPKIPSLHRVRSFDDYEPLTTRRHAEFLTYLREGSTTPSRPTYLFDGYLNTLTAPDGRPSPATRRRLLDLAAVRLVLFPGATFRRPEIRPFLIESGLYPHGRIHGIPAFENRSSLPRAFVTYRTIPAPDADALLGALARPDFDPLAASYVEGDPPFTPAVNAPERGAPAAIVRDEPTLVELDATLEAPGLVVLADSFYPGWQASVDDVPAPIAATNHLFRGVAAPAGRHRIRFAYRPASLRIGAAASLVGLALLGTLVFPRRGRRP